MPYFQTHNGISSIAVTNISRVKEGREVASCEGENANAIGVAASLQNMQTQQRRFEKENDDEGTLCYIL